MPAMPQRWKPNSRASARMRAAAAWGSAWAALLDMAQV
jgi:hypothetical protein